MSFKYEKAVPWGRSFDEYQRMFNLTNEDLCRKILGCADGPASFNAGMAKLGRRVVSCDPLYQLTASQIRARIDATHEEVMKQTQLNQEKFVWDNFISSPKVLGRVRLQAMSDFLADYEAGRAEGRYLPIELPDLPFPGLFFDLALCAHFLFFYSDSLSLEFHQLAVDELCRVAREVRIFPILTYNAEPSPCLDPFMDFLKAQGKIVSLERVPYEFQRAGNVMLRVTNSPS